MKQSVCMYGTITESGETRKMEKGFNWSLFVWLPTNIFLVPVKPHPVTSDFIASSFKETKTAECFVSKCTAAAFLFSPFIFCIHLLLTCVFSSCWSLSPPITFNHLNLLRPSDHSAASEPCCMRCCEGGQRLAFVESIQSDMLFRLTWLDPLTCTQHRIPHGPQVCIAVKNSSTVL